MSSAESNPKQITSFPSQEEGNPSLLSYQITSPGQYQWCAVRSRLGKATHIQSLLQAQSLEHALSTFLPNKLTNKAHSLPHHQIILKTVSSPTWILGEHWPPEAIWKRLLQMLWSIAQAFSLNPSSLLLHFFFLTEEKQPSLLPQRIKES